MKNLVRIFLACRNFFQEKLIARNNWKWVKDALSLSAKNRFDLSTDRVILKPNEFSMFFLS